MCKAYQLDGSGLKSKRISRVKYECEYDRLYVLSDDEAFLIVPKNRSVPRSSLFRPTHPLSLAFRLLGAAFLGLAPAGLGTLVLAPLAGAWAIGVFIARPLSRGDRVRVAVVLGIVAGLLGIAIPLSAAFLARFF
jgi:hypothetical protein